MEITHFEKPVPTKGRKVVEGDVVLAAFGNPFEVWSIGEITTHGVTELVFRNQTGTGILCTTPVADFEVIAHFEVTA